MKSLTSRVRDPRAGYKQSLDVLAYLKKQGKGTYTKSSLMLGLGEKHEEILQAMQDLRQAGVDFLTLGQYLQPTRKHLKVEEYLKPEIFEEFAQEGHRLSLIHI